MEELMTENIVEFRDGKPVVSSLQLARRFGKRHGWLVRWIKNLGVSRDFAARNFLGSSYQDANNQSRPMFWITYDGFCLVPMKVAGREAMLLIEHLLTAFGKAKQTVDIAYSGRAVSDINQLIDVMKFFAHDKHTHKATRSTRSYDGLCQLESHVASLEETCQLYVDKIEWKVNSLCRVFGMRLIINWAELNIGMPQGEPIIGTLVNTLVAWCGQHGPVAGAAAFATGMLKFAEENGLSEMAVLAHKVIDEIDELVLRLPMGGILLH
jgi:Rha family phage regulatory protein